MTLFRVAGAALPIDSTDFQDAEIVSFRTAFENVNRGALQRYIHSKQPTDEAAKRAAANEYHLLPLLWSPELFALAQRAAAAAREQRVRAYDISSFPAMLWMGGATATYGGVPLGVTMLGFIHLLQQRSTVITPKRTGWVIEPTTNSNGHRTNESTKAIHALFLDCDGRGEWGMLREHLDRLDYAYVAYQSGGWSPQTPKWRVVLPLHVPFDTSTEDKQQAWKTVYNCARVVFGALGGLLGEGFDPATDTPCCPWFLTERRDEAAPPRQVHWRWGYPLDIVALTLALPPIEDDRAPRREHSETVATELSNEKRLELIDALARVTANIPSGRHELYLALPGALLHRGIDPDEVRDIIEAVSASYPRRHADKHKDNLHNANTTINKFVAGAKNITSIGTLNERWPEIARAIDEVLPNTLNELLLESMSDIIEANTATSPAQQATADSAATASRRKRKLSSLGKEVLLTIKRMETSGNVRRRSGAALLKHILWGEPLQTSNQTTEQVDELVKFAMEQFGFNVPIETQWQEVFDLASESLHSAGITQSVERSNAAQLAFKKGQKKRRKWMAKRQAEVEELRQRALPSTPQKTLSVEEANAFFSRKRGE